MAIDTRYARAVGTAEMKLVLLASSLNTTLINYSKYSNSEDALVRGIESAVSEIAEIHATIKAIMDEPNPELTYYTEDECDND